MEELEKIKKILPMENDKQFPVDARALHKALKVKTLFKDWIKRRLEEADAIEGRDYRSNLSSPSGHENVGQTQRKDYSLTIQIAKEIAMLERTNIGKLVRRYFIACEEQLKSSTPHSIPQTLSEALRLAADLEDQKQKALAENAELKPKANKWEAFMNAEGNFTFESAAKILKTGQNRLFALLREQGYIFRNKENYNTPYQTKVDAGYFVVKAKTYWKGDKEVTYPQVFITPKGLEHIIKKYFNPTQPSRRQSKIITVHANSAQF